ncbi:helicase associated domain-containing protein [Kitasatospora sp. NPDC058190]|uniref:helicase associated domain-containing protein n=1 Tax=Kitasatospora sp. NPDC058190 TaxID=3346371 RepID=UPI0036D7FEB7
MAARTAVAARPRASRADPFQQGLAALAAFVEREGNARVPRTHKTAEGLSLGTWLNNTRAGLLPQLQPRTRLPTDRPGQPRAEKMTGLLWKADIVHEKTNTSLRAVRSAAVSADTGSDSGHSYLSLRTFS